MVEEKIDAAAAKAIIQQEAKERIEICTQEINEILTKNKCQLDVSMNLSNRGIVPQIQIIPKVEE